MRAISQHAFGGPGELRLEDVPDPRPAAGEVRVRVQAAGIHLVDTLLRRGERAGPLPLPQLPMTPGREVAGVVDAIGDGVDASWLGRLVVANLGPASGGYAELAVAPAAALHPLPAGIDPAEAVAMVGTGRTAVAILDVAAPAPSDVALVTAAAGGVGSLLVQALHNLGATVVAAAGSAAKASLAQELGAAIAVDYSQPGWTQRIRDALGERPLTLVLDGVGGEAGRAALEQLRAGGRLVLFGSASGTPTELSATDLFTLGITASAAVGARYAQRSPDEQRAFAHDALEAAAAGALKPLVARYALADAPAAHAAIESRATTGKVVLEP